MMDYATACLLRVYLAESDHRNQRPLHELIVEAALRHGLAGATVLRGVMGYGRQGRVHTERILALGENLPVVVELVDRPEAIENLLEELASLLDGVLATVEQVRIPLFKSKAGPT